MIPDALDSAFPFHAIVDDGGVVVSCGRLLRRASPTLVGQAFPGVPSLAPGRATLALGGVVLQGSLVPLDERHIVFLATPLVRDLADLAKLPTEADSRTRKLEAVGQLAAGIAHEINTPVQYVSDSVHFLRDAFDEVRGLLKRYRDRAGDAVLAEDEAAADLPYLDEQVPRAFERVFDGTGRVADIVRAMKEFARPDAREMAAADFNKAVLATLTVCRNEYRYHAVVSTELADLPPVRCHIGDLNQVTLNLVVNAAHAVADAGKSADSGGSIVVRTRRDGDFAVVVVEDNGCGIPDEVAPRIFDPFFTTKEVGRGTGQGLAIAHAIVAKHRGTLTFATAPGTGTAFSVRVPIGP